MRFYIIIIITNILIIIIIIIVIIIKSSRFILSFFWSHFDIEHFRDVWLMHMTILISA